MNRFICSTRLPQEEDRRQLVRLWEECLRRTSHILAGVSGADAGKIRCPHRWFCGSREKSLG